MTTNLKSAPDVLSAPATSPAILSNSAFSPGHALAGISPIVLIAAPVIMAAAIWPEYQTFFLLAGAGGLLFFFMVGSAIT